MMHHSYQGARNEYKIGGGNILYRKLWIKTHRIRCLCQHKMLSLQKER